MAKVSAKNIVEIAANEIGYSHTGSDNHTKYHTDCGLAMGQPWCACFVNWCFLKACGSKKEASKLLHGWEFTAKSFYDNAPKSQKWSGKSKTPRVGDIVIMKGSSGDWHHVGIVVNFKNNKVSYISGNDGNDSVSERTKEFGTDYFNGFVRPNYSGTTTSASTKNYDTKIKVKFTAYYPDDSEMEGGFYDCKGKKLRPDKKNLCAVPKDIMNSDKWGYGTKIKFESSNNKAVDGKIYEAVDVGGAINKDGDVYHIDICVVNKSACDKFANGTGYGYINYDESADEVETSTTKSDAKTMTESIKFDNYELINVSDDISEYWNFQETITYEVEE